jgi:hypothetical protein
MSGGMIMSQKNLGGQIVSLVALLAVTAFLIIGFATDGWSLAWLVFLMIPITAIITDIIFKKKNVTGLVTGLVALIATIAYMILGFIFGLWHPGWIIFLSIPITRVVCGMITGETEDDKGDQKKDE